MKTSRENHTATLLADGRVLVTGGDNETNSFLSDAEFYNPTNGIWTAVSSLSTPRKYHTATLLPNGNVLVAGGQRDGSTVLNTAALFDPVSGIWSNTGSLFTGHWRHTANLLPSGKVLVSSGEFNTSGGFTGISETYDPASGKWTQSGAVTTARIMHTTTLLANGKVLIAGGQDFSFNILASAELYDAGLGFSASWQPLIATATSPLSLGSSLTISGSRLRGISEGSCGSSQDSPADYPVLQLHSLQTDQIVFVASTSWSGSSVVSAAVNGLPVGHAFATVFVNGIPSASSIIRIGAPQIILAGATKLPNGSFQFFLTNTPGSAFTVLATTNVTQPLSNWTVLGAPIEGPPGVYQFTDPQAPNNPQRFYNIRAP
jgi:hypothetical protein